MRFRITILFIGAVVGGLLWSLGSNVHSIVAHFIIPPLFGIAVAFLFRSESFVRQLYRLLIFLSIAEFVRLIAYSVADGWFYITNDGETQMALLLSFVLQCVIGFATMGAVRLLAGKHQHQSFSEN